jgi:hypothetical protein
MVDSTKNSLELIIYILKPEYSISEMMLDNIRVWIVISRSNIYVLPTNKLDINLVKCMVLAASNDPELQEANNMSKDHNTRTNTEYLVLGPIL